MTYLQQGLGKRTPCALESCAVSCGRQSFAEVSVDTTCFGAFFTEEPTCTLCRSPILVYGRYREVLWASAGEELAAMAETVASFEARCRKMPRKLREWEAFQVGISLAIKPSSTPYNPPFAPRLLKSIAMMAGRHPRWAWYEVKGHGG